MDVVVFDTVEALHVAAATEVEKYFAAGGRDLGLAGGGTPQPVYERLVDASVDWSDVVLWIGDERWVPADHDDSNTAMAKRTFVDTVGAHLLAPDTSASDPHHSAHSYEQRLRSEIGVDSDGQLAAGLVLLGMGDDGHTASLFPETVALGEIERDYVANWVEEKSTWRLTATFPALWNARRLVFLVAGAGKAGVLRQIIEDGAHYPAQRVAAGNPNTLWMLDAAAASELSATPR